MNEAWRSRLRAGVGGPTLWSFRKRTILKTADDFISVGTAMSRFTAPDSETSDAIQAIALLLRIAGELARAAGKMLSKDEHYAGAALVRQIVEIEYLTWTFKENYRSAHDWLRSSHNDRRKMFQPVQLRKTSKGRFLDKDYQTHCEQGGHPVPIGAFLLNANSPKSAQVLLIDLLCHCWRTWDQIVVWSNGIPEVAPCVQLHGHRISKRLNGWDSETQFTH